MNDRVCSSILQAMCDNFSTTPAVLAPPLASATEFDKLLAQADALAASRPILDSSLESSGFVIWTVSWNSFAMSPTPPYPGAWDVSFHGHDWESNRNRSLYKSVSRVDVLIPFEPTAADVARVLLMVSGSGVGLACNAY
jgi:hypothetical protein